MTIEEVRAETIARLKQAFEQAVDPHLRDAYERRSGSALTNGWCSLRDQGLYVMGHNPGGDAATHPRIGDHTERLTYDAKGLRSDGSSQFNRVVRPLISCLGQDPDQTFVTNALFVRSRGTNNITTEEAAIFDACWPVHEWFLSIVRPRLILCLGYRQDPKRRLPFRRIVEKMVSPILTPIVAGRHQFGAYATGQLPVAEGLTLHITVAGVYHPSARRSCSWSSERIRVFKEQIAPWMREMLNQPRPSKPGGVC